MNRQLIIELKVINHQLSQIRRTTSYLPSLSDIYEKVEKELDED